MKTLTETGTKSYYTYGRGALSGIPVRMFFGSFQESSLVSQRIKEFPILPKRDRQ